MKIILLLIIATILLSFCAIASTVSYNEEIKSKPEPEHEPVQYNAPPLYHAFLFNSVSEMVNEISNGTINGVKVDDVINFFEEDEDDKGIVKKLISNIKKGSLYIPTHKDKEVSYSNREGFRNISIYTSELYGKPWIKYSLDRKSGIIGVSIMYLDKGIKTNHDNISELISEIAPEAPNVHNYEDFPHLVKIYTSELKISDRKVNTIVHEIVDDKRRSIFFAYDKILVRLVTVNENIPNKWLRNFSFAQYKDLYKDVIVIRKGHVLGNPNISIFDALEILKHITGMESVIDTCENARAAALIVSNDVPGIFDVLEILKALAGMESAVSG